MYAVKYLQRKYYSRLDLRLTGRFKICHSRLSGVIVKAHRKDFVQETGLGPSPSNLAHSDEVRGQLGLLADAVV